tara:strand:- start:276 stop:515 length:240 start_codon:yes stop_codon:yes gene_type:complete
MEKKFIIIALAMGSLGFGQEIIPDSLNNNKNVIVVSDSLKTIEKTTTSVQCGGTAKSTGNQCKLKTKHSSGQCHHHRKD